MTPSKTEERVIIIAPVGQDAEAMATMLGAQGYQSTRGDYKKVIHGGVPG